METATETKTTNGYHQDAIREAPPPAAPSAAAEFCSPSITRLALALAKAQSAFGPIERTRTVTVRPKEKPHYTFSYAPLDTVLAATLPALNANGLALISMPVDNGNRLRTLLLHESGEWMAVEVGLPSWESAQAFGSALTYMRRYSAVSLLGVASEEDDDGNAADGSHVESKQERPRRQQQEAAPEVAPEDLISEQDAADLDELVFKQLKFTPNFLGMWLFGRFGTREPKKLSKKQGKTAAKLLLAYGKGKDAYAAALKAAVEAGECKA